MLNLIRPRSGQAKCDGSTRRDFLKVGTLSLFGLTLPELLRARAASGARKDTAVVLLFLDGGASQIETFDPKMDSPKEYRSIFGVTKTSIPGVEYGAQLPKLAALAHKTSVLRALTHTDGDHGGATHWMKTGRPWPPEFLGKAAVIPQQTPAIGSMLARWRGAVNKATGVPTYVRVLSDHGGFPGDDAVWLGQEFNPMRVGQGRGNPLLNDMSLKIAPRQLADRHSLLRAFDALDRAIDQTGIMDGMDGFQQQAMTVLLGKAKDAFDLEREDPKVRDRYGPGLGQELLLARRLCEAGAGFVTLNNGYWDHHGGIIPGCEKLCPPLDHAASVFIEDIHERGLDQNILLLITGEFGRTPRINGGPGRDHWAPLNAAVLAGGGLRMGQVVGVSDEKGAYPKSRPLSPADLQATIFDVLGIDRDVQYLHPTGRPISMIEDGKPIEELT
ncbi:MAG: DUF1501 domain-containing protein [Gemmataceae bacterium]